jgi:hypothetical protein
MGIAGDSPRRIAQRVAGAEAGWRRVSAALRFCAIHAGRSVVKADELFRS